MEKKEEPLQLKKIKSAQDDGELRQDLINGDWIVLATGRAKRPGEWRTERPKPKIFKELDDSCPFCRLDLFPQEPDILRLPDDPEEWQVHIFQNLYPAFTVDDDFRSWQVGPYRAMESVGYHEVLATRRHNQLDAKITVDQLALQLEALVLRYRQLMMKPSVNFIQIIKNHGEAAGGSLEHPHHQILTVPVLPSEITDRLNGAQQYAKINGRDPFSVMVDFELKEKTRVVAKNDNFVAFCPFASRVPFEVWIMPLTPNPYFENIGPSERESLAEIMVNVLSRLYVGLNDPPYNYYVLSAPCDQLGFVCHRSLFDSWRWHIEILPRLNVWGGFELGTGLEINTAAPEESAQYLASLKQFKANK